METFWSLGKFHSHWFPPGDAILPRGANPVSDVTVQNSNSLEIKSATKWRKPLKLFKTRLPLFLRLYSCSRVGILSVKQLHEDFLKSWKNQDSTGYFREQTFHHMRSMPCFRVTVSTVNEYPNDLNTFYAQVVPFPVLTHQNIIRTSFQRILGVRFQGQQWPWTCLLGLKFFSQGFQFNQENKTGWFWRIKPIFTRALHSWPKMTTCKRGWISVRFLSQKNFYCLENIASMVLFRSKSIWNVFNRKMTLFSNMKYSVKSLWISKQGVP